MSSNDIHDIHERARRITDGLCVQCERPLTEDDAFFTCEGCRALNIEENEETDDGLSNDASTQQSET